MQRLSNSKSAIAYCISKAGKSARNCKKSSRPLKYRDESQSRRLAEKQARLDELEIQAAEQNPPPAINLSEQAPEIYNFFKQWLPSDTKWPKKTLLELRNFLESKEINDEPE
jgi:hypothetical protein